MLRTLFVFLLFTHYIAAAEWNWTKEVSLKKDQYQSLVVKEGTLLRELKFRWTLFAGDGLVIHLNYNNTPSQFILYEAYKQNSHRIALLPKRSAFKRVPYLYLRFKKFDFAQSQAVFEIGLEDPEKRALIEWKASK